MTTPTPDQAPALIEKLMELVEKLEARSDKHGKAARPYDEYNPAMRDAYSRAAGELAIIAKHEQESKT